jgi:hypothetical protein
VTIEDFLLDLNGKDWGKLLSYWAPLLPQDHRLWLVNRFGDLFFTSSDNAVHRLIVGTGKIERLAPDKESFARELDRMENAERWLRILLTIECKKAGMGLRHDECFGFKVPPALAGAYEISNLEPTNIYSHYSWLAHLAKQEEIFWTGN